MGRLGVNLTDVETGRPDVPLYPAGIYAVQVKSYKPKTNTNNKHYLNWLFEVVNHPEYNTKPMFYDTYLSSEAAMFTLKRLGIACEALLPDGDVDDDLCIGKIIMVNVTVKTHDQNGQELKNPRNEVEVII